MSLERHSGHFGFSPSYYDGMLLSSYIAKLSHLLQYMTINRMTNLAFGGHFGFSFPTHLAQVDEMEVLWIMAQEGFWTSPEKFSFLYFFSRLNCIAPGL